MRAPAALLHVLFGSGLLLSGGAVIALALAATSDGSMEDLGYVAGAVFLAALSALPYGGFLLASRAAAARPPRWQLGLATLLGVVGLVAAVSVASVNERTLLFLGLPAALLFLAGVAASLKAWGRPTG